MGWGLAEVEVWRSLVCRGIWKLVEISLFFCGASTHPAPKLKCLLNELYVLGQGHVASLLTSDLRRSLFNASGCCDHPDLIIRMGFQWLPLYINLNNGPSSQKEGNPQSLPICSERLFILSFWLDAFYYPMHATISKQCHGVWGDI